MKYIAYPALFAILFFSCKKKHDAPTPTYPAPVFTTYNGSVGSNDLSAIVTNDNNVMMVGQAKNGNILLYKVSQTGGLLWNKEVSITGMNVYGIYSIVQCPDDNYLLCGTSSLNGIDILLMKVNSAGDMQWTKTYGGALEDYGGRIIKTKDDNYLICGTSYSYTAEAYEDIYLVKVSANGDKIWSHNYNLHEQQVPFHVLETQNGEYLVTGTNEPTGFERVIYLLKVSANGDKLWDSNIGSTTDPSHFYWWGYCSAECTNGDLVVTGAYKNQMFAVKTDATGNVLWKKSYYPDDSLLQEFGSSIRRNADNTFTATGNSYDYRDQSSKCILLKFDNDGNQLYYKRLPGTDSYAGVDLLKCSNGDNMIIGNNYRDTSLQNIFFTRTDVDGNYK